MEEHRFGLAVECGQDSEAARQIAHYFDGLNFTLITGKFSSCASSTEKDDTDHCYAIVLPSNLNETSDRCSSFNDAIEMTEVGLRLYRHLLEAPPFRYAQVGIDVNAEAATGQLLPEVWSNSQGMRIVLTKGLVTREELWEELGKPFGFNLFRPGYYWSPYLGESVSPIDGDDKAALELTKLEHQLPWYGGWHTQGRDSWEKWLAEWQSRLDKGAESNT